VFNRKLSVAVIQGRKWTLAQVIRDKTKLKVLKISQYSMEEKDKGALDVMSFEKSLSNDSETTIGSESSDPEPIVKLKDWLKQQKVPLKKLKLAVSCPGTITRIITLPKMSNKDLNKLLTEQVSQYFTFNIADYLVDYRIVDVFEEEGQKRQRILLAALPMFQWKQFCSNMDSLGLKPTVIDLTADSLARLYGKLSNSKTSFKMPFEIPFKIPLKIPFQKLTKKSHKKPSKKPSKKVHDLNDQALDIAIVDLGTERVEFIILEKGLFFLYSDQEVALEGLNNINSFLSPVPEEKAPLESEEIFTNNSYSDLEDALNPVLRTLGEFLTFFAARHYGKSIDKIFLTGELADLPSITELFETSLEVQTQQGFPENWKPDFVRQAQENQRDWMKYGSLYGLAMRED